MDNLVLNRLYKIVSSSKRTLFDQIASERTKYITVVLEDIVKEFNSSAVIRSCDCFGVQELNIIAQHQKFKIQREIAKGSSSWVDITSFSENDNPDINCINLLRKRGYRIVATSPHAEKTINEIEIDQPIALVFGTERHGISQNIISNADEIVKIPMYGFTESFNISVSVAITLNLLRNKLEMSDLKWKLTKDEQTELKINWCKKIIRNGTKVEAEIRRRILEKE